MAPIAPVAPELDEAVERHRVRARMFELVRASQLDGELTRAHVDAMIDEGERRG